MQSYVIRQVIDEMSAEFKSKLEQEQQKSEAKAGGLTEQVRKGRIGGERENNAFTFLE